MKKSLMPLVAATALAASALPAQAKEGDLVARVRATYVAPDASSKLNLSGYGHSDVTAGFLSPDTNTIPEVDFSYYFTDHIAAELILATGSRHNVVQKGSAEPVSANPIGNLGSVNLLPPTLTAQWHLSPDQTIDPYVGVGINYTRFMDNSLLGGAIHTGRHSFGPAIQFGADYNLPGGWLLNLDVKKIWIQTDVKLAGIGKIDSLDIDPWVVSLGFGRKF